MIVPPGALSAPTKITCRLVSRDRLSHPPPMKQAESLASKVVEMGPPGLKFLKSDIRYTVSTFRRNFQEKFILTSSMLINCLADAGTVAHTGQRVTEYLQLSARSVPCNIPLGACQYSRVLLFCVVLLPSS